MNKRLYFILIISMAIILTILVEVVQVEFIVRNVLWWSLGLVVITPAIIATIAGRRRNNSPAPSSYER